MENPAGKARKKRIVRKFFTTLAFTMGIFLLAFVVVVVGMSFFGMKPPGASYITENFENTSGIMEFFNEKEKEAARDNFLIVGVDGDGTHTDAIVIGSFNHETEALELISIPRDTKVTMAKDRVEALKQKGHEVPSDGVMKLTEVHHYARDLGVSYLEKQVEELLGFKSDFYVKVNLNAFGYLVDEIGGVEFDVPQRMYYNDPTQNLLIDLHPGVQTLNGKKAEGLVRFRSYPQGDIKRMEVQQAFMKAFIKQALQKDNMVNNAAAAVTTMIKYVDTDFNMTKLPGYLKYVKSFKAENISTYTLPVSGTTYINKKSYVLLDEQGSRDLVQATFFESGTVEDESANGKRIQVLNGGNASGIAKQGKERLEEKGFLVESIGDYNGARENNTRIFVNSRSLGKDIQAVFEGSVVVFDPNLDKNYDIVVVIGKNGL